MILAHAKPVVIDFAAKPVTIQAAAGSGEPRRFRIVACTGDPMPIWPYDFPVICDLDSVDLSTQSLPALYDHVHDADFIVGQVQSLTLEAGQLIAEGIFTPTDAPIERNYCRKVLDRADAGYRWQASIGGNQKELQKIEAGGSVIVNGRNYSGPVFVARGVVLREISFVVLGGDRHTSAVVARHRASLRSSAMNPSFEDWVASLGFTVADLNEQQAAALKIQFAAIYPDGEETETEVETETPVVPETPTNAGATAPVIQAGGASGTQRPRPDGTQTERTRVVAINSLCAENGNPTITAGGRQVQLSAHAIQNGWGTERVKTELLKVLRASQSAGPAIISRDRAKDNSMQALQGAMLIRAGGKLTHPGYGRLGAVQLLPAWLRASMNDDSRNQIMEHADRLSKWSAVDLAREALRANGKEVPHDRDDMIQASFSSGSLGNLITTSMNATLIQTYFDSPDTTQGWVKENDVANYLQNERIRILKGGSLAEQPEGATADHDTMEDVAETYKINRFSKQFEVDEIAMINDDLGGIQEKPVEFGNAAARLRPDMVYATILANPTLAATTRALFNATEANLITGSALASGTLSTALARMALIRENGVNIDVNPSHLIVPPTLRDSARVLVGSPINIIAGTAGSVTTVGNVNPLNDYQLQLVAEKRLENGVIHPKSLVSYGGSASAWYVASALAPALEVGYLRGTGRVPRVRSWVYQDKGKFGQGWDVSMSIGVCVLDWKGLEKITA